MAKDFFKNTIDGVEMEITFIFDKAYISGNSDLILKMGTATMLRYNDITNKQVGFNMRSKVATSHSSGISITQGDLMFRVLNEGNLAMIARRLIDSEVKTLEDNLLKYKKSPFVNDVEIIDVVVEKESAKGAFYLEDFQWSDLPFFDIHITALLEKNNPDSKRIMKVEGVKVNSYGQSESVSSTEMNDIISFTSLGGVTPWHQSWDALLKDMDEFIETMDK